MKTLSLVPAKVSTVETATFKGALRNVGVGIYRATAKFAGYNAAIPTNTTQMGGRVGTNSNSTFASMQRVGMNFTAELVAKNSAIGAAYLSQRQNYCSSQLTYIPSTGDTGLDAEIKQYLHGYDGFGGVFSEMGAACSMQDAFMRTADQELPVRGDSGLIFWRDAQGNLRLLEFSADQLGEIYSFTNPRTCGLSRNSAGQIVESSNGTPCVYFAGIYMSGADVIAYKIYERTSSFYGNPTIYESSDVIFFKDPASFRGIRGVTIFANALEHMQKGEDMLSAALSSAQRQARTAFYVTNGRGGPDESSYETDVFDDGTTSYRERVPGGPLVEYGYTGETMAAVSPTTPGPEIIQGVETADERVAIALRTNYAFLISCTKVGGAPSRLEVEKANKEFQRIQNTIHRPRLRRIIDVVLMDAMRKGDLQPPQGMTAEQFKRGRWQLPISPSVDAFYDAKENIAMMRSGLESAQDIIAETNRNADEVLEKSKQWAVACSMAVQDANKELKAAGYTGDVTAMDIAQVSDNPQQAAQAEIDPMGNPANKETVKMSAFVGDVKIGKLPTSQVEELAKHVQNGDEGISDIIVSRYGMTVPELLPKADPHNLDTARKHIRYATNGACADEVHANEDKCILINQDRIIDGHHFLAKAEKGKVSKSLPVIDISPVRFQSVA